MRSLGVLVLGLIGLCSLPPVLSAAVPAVELVADAPMLQPTSTLEFRFARPIVTREEVGVPGAKVPFQLSPAIPGSFTWLSRSSGVFVPESAWPMAGKFTVTVSRDLRTAEGKPLGGELQVELTTPGFQQTGDHGFGNGEAAYPRPELGLAYNLPVDLTGAAQLIRFVNSDGRTIPSEVRHATSRDYFPLQPEEDDWQSRWEKSRNPATERNEDDWRNDAPPVPKPNKLIITPAEPLQPGGVWSLEVKPGLRSQDGRHQDKNGTTAAVGAVMPFEIRTLEAASYVNSGRSLVITFSHDVAPDITVETASRFLRVEPPVANFRVEESYQTLTLRGDFERGKEYTLYLEPTLVSADGLPLAGPAERPFRFAPVSPRLYLPEFTGHQVRDGLRKFEVASVNLKSLKVTLRRIPAEQVPRTITAFEKYDSDGLNEAEPYQAIPTNLIPGEVIHERVIELPPPVLDARQQTTLDWDSLLGAGVGGPIFLTVAGEPLPEAGGKAVAAQAFIQLTDLGILWKQTDEGVRVSAFSMANGESLPKAQVTILAKDYLILARGVTGEMGTTTLPISKPPGWLLVSKGDDVHAMRLGYEGTELPMAAFRLPTSYRGWEPRPTDKADVRGLIFTDRPLYRPGETVRVKGILRVFGKEGLTAGEGFKGTLHLQDPKGDDAGTFDVQTDARGAFDSEVVLPGSPHGRYGLRLSIGETDDSGPSGFYAAFQVADYQPNAFNVDLELPSRLAAGQGIDARLRASYYFGSPVRDAKARWTLRYTRDRFAPEGFYDWRFGMEEDGTPAVLTLQGSSELTKPEGLAIQPQLPEPKGSPYRGVLTAEVTDINQQTVTDTREFQRDASSFYLGVTVPDGIVNRAGQELTYAVAAVGADGTPLPQPVEVKAELIRVHHNTVRVQGAGKAISFRTEKREEPIAEAVTKTTQLEERGGRWEALQWTKTGFKPAQAGQYRLRVTAKDAGGRTAESDFHLYVTGADQLAWDYRNPAQVDMVPDKKEYQPGETARVLLKAPISGDALVTIERGGKILRTIRTRLEGNAPSLEIPLTAADAPNVFVSVVLIRGLEQSTRKVKTPEYRYGAAMLQVRDSKAFLQVAIHPTREHVEPGDPVEADVLVTDGSDRPVADADVTFFAVDDGVLALTGYERPMLQPIFHAAVPLAIRTGLSLHKLLPEDPAALVFANKGYLIGGGGLEGPGMKLRRDFPGTAAWFPSLRTDAQGKVRVTFRAPDALTRYRLVAVAHAAAHLFGSGESAVAIRKSLMVLPALGQFANVGDQLIARAVIRNESGADGVADVSLQLDDSAESANGVTTARVELRNGEARAVDLPLRLRRTGSAEWKWSARMKLPTRELDDHVVSQLVVRSPAPVLRETYLTELSAASTNLLEGVNPQLLEGRGVVATTVSNTRLSSLRESVNQLWDYPYGCAEQTTSALIPWALYTQLKPILPEVVKTDAEVTGAIQAGLERVFAQQLENGGVTMWPGGNQGSTFLTAYTAIACSILQAQGIALPERHEQLLDFLSEGLRGLANLRDEPLLGEQALALYALAVSGKAEPAYHEALFARRAELSRESRALLASAILESKGPAKMVGQLLDPKAAAPEGMSWYGGPARERAIQLLAWSRYKPKDPEVAKLVKELLEHRRSGHFGTTQGNAWALLALTKYYAAVERGGPAVISGNIVAPGGSTPFRVTRAEPAAGVSIAFSPEIPLEVLSVRNPAKSTLFGETRFVVQPPVARQPRQDRGFAVSRSYQKLANDGSLAPADGLKVGDRVLVTLRVEATRPAHFVAIDDPLPAVLEAVNPAFRSRGAAGAENAVEWTADHREIRADRVLYFCDHLPPGAFTFRYLARVRSAGKVTGGATKVEEMYRPERFGLGESIELAALPAEVK